MPGSACRPKIRETPSSTPASMAIRAPPGMISSAEPDGAAVDARIRMQTEDRGAAAHHPRLDGHQGTAGHDLLGGLEDQPYPAGQLVGHPLERQTGPQECRGVQVVAARVRDALDGAGPRVVGAVVDR